MSTLPSGQKSHRNSDTEKLKKNKIGKKNFGTKKIKNFRFSKKIQDYFPKNLKRKDNKLLLQNRYEVLKIIGKGSFSTVFKAFDIKSEKFVAIKCFSQETILKKKIDNLIQTEKDFLY